MSKEFAFNHLHVHTEYSLLDGAVRITDLIKAAVEYGMPAVAVTDHGNLYGAIELYQQAAKAGVKAIIGCELYVETDANRDYSFSPRKRRSAHHLTVLAQNEEGYQNLVQLVSSAHLVGFYYKPLVNKRLIATHSKGLIALSGCLKGEINSCLVAGQIAQAKAATAVYRDIFGSENFFLELQDHGIEAQARCNPYLIEFSKDIGVELVLTNDVHFLQRSHHEAHDIMICIGTGAMVYDEKRVRSVPELYLKSPQEMRALFPRLSQAADNTLRIAERCNLKLEFGQPRYPVYNHPSGTTREKYFRKLCRDGLEKRFGQDRATQDTSLRCRLEYELSVIEMAGFVSYFLIVWDFINFAKQQDIPVGPGRGSAAGSLVAYVLGITDLDPIYYGLIFERFLNPERITPPDIDIDFCQNRREEVIEYVRKKYGERSVAQIITFGSFGAKSVVRDVGRVLSWKYTDADRIAKMIPNEPSITLQTASKKNRVLRDILEKEPRVRQLWDYALILEGLSRNTGIHAAGVVIGDHDLLDYIPLCKGKDGEIVTQYSMEPLNDLGMLKMDFLGLKTLTVIYDSIALIRKRQPDFDIAQIPSNDTRTFNLLKQGETIGIFQLESSGMTNTCRRFQIQNIDDIIALIALYRPGPMDLIDEYIERKKGLKKIEYAHPLLKSVCSDTFGLMIYQEQVQKAASVLAGYSLGQADLLRRAMGKKDKASMAKERARFISGCWNSNNISEKQAANIFDLLEKFAGYGFNKSHSAAYGLLCYQTAFLKANYPTEFMAGLLSNEMNNTEKIAILVAECQKMQITILPPDINRSTSKFAPADDQQAIRFGLAAIKNVGAQAVSSIIQERNSGGEFQCLEDVCNRLDPRTVHRKLLENLIKCGACDCFGHSRASLFTHIEIAMAAAVAVHRDKSSGQISLFSGDGENCVASKLPISEVAPWSSHEILSYEKELLGFYVTGHPLDTYRGALECAKKHHVKIADIRQLPEGASVRKMAGMLLTVEKKLTKADSKPYATVIVEDFTGAVEASVWNEVVLKCSESLKVGNVVSILAQIVKREEALRVTIKDVHLLQSSGSPSQPLRIKLKRKLMSEKILGEILDSIVRHPGSRRLLIDFIDINGKASCTVHAGNTFLVGNEADIIREIGKYLVT